MTLLTSIRPLSGAPLLACTTPKVRSRALSLARAIDSQFDLAAGAGDPVLDGYCVLPAAHMAITATSLPYPAWNSECGHDAWISDFDIVVLRFDRVRGVTLDILPRDGSNQLCHYRVWSLDGQGLWFIPTACAAPFIRATSRGLIWEAEPPFGRNSERNAGIITTIACRSLEGNC